MLKKKQGDKGRSTSYADMESQKMEIKSIMKDIEFLGSKHMTWKARKELENRKVVSLGGKPVKKQRLPLSVARVTMKKQKERDQKMLEESLILGRFGAKFSSGGKRVVDKRKPEDRVLKSSVGTFRNGVLDVKQFLKPAASRDGGDGGYSGGGGSGSYGGGKSKKRKGGKKNQGKKKGAGRKRH